MRIGLALGSGGAKGLCHIAFLKALDDLEVKPAVISGTSVGAIFAGLYAAGVSGAEMEQVVKDWGFRDLARVFLDFSLFNKSALFDGDTVEQIITGLVMARTFEELTIPLKVVATSFWSREQIVFESGDLLPALRASMAMPGVFSPGLLEDTLLIDGGAVNPLPYDLIQNECDLTIAIDALGERTCLDDDLHPGLLDGVLSTFQIMQASIIQAKKHCSPPDIYVRPNLVNIRTLDFYRHAEILESVEADVAEFKETLLSKLAQGQEAE
jgi:NTE family protein